jgi:hypothetical protein
VGRFPVAAAIDSRSELRSSRSALGNALSMMKKLKHSLATSTV